MVWAILSSQVKHLKMSCQLLPKGLEDADSLDCDSEHGGGGDVVHCKGVDHLVRNVLHRHLPLHGAAVAADDHQAEGPEPLVARRHHPGHCSSVTLYIANHEVLNLSRMNVTIVTRRSL